MRLEIFLGLISVVSPASAQESPIHLICSGQAQVTQRRTMTAYGTNSLGQYSNVTVGTDHVENSDEDIRIDLDGSIGSIRLPVFMLPPVHGGKNGVLPLRDISYNEGEIVARATLNIMNQPKIVLDRMTGAVYISGFREVFRGKCQAYDPTKIHRAF